MHRPPLSKRNNPEQIEEYFTLQEKLSEPLKYSLLNFIDEHFRSQYTVSQFERRNDRVLPHDRKEMLQAFWNDDSFLLDAVDHIVGEEYDAEDVKNYLDDSRSIYDVGLDDQGRFQLQRRQPPELSELVESALSMRGRAYDHLRRGGFLRV